MQELLSWLHFQLIFLNYNFSMLYSMDNFTNYGQQWAYLAAVYKMRPLYWNVPLVLLEVKFQQNWSQMKYHHLIHSNLPEIKEIPVQMYRAVHGFSKDKVNYSTYTDKRTESFNYAIGTLFFQRRQFFSPRKCNIHPIFSSSSFLFIKKGPWGKIKSKKSVKFLNMEAQQFP